MKRRNFLRIFPAAGVTPFVLNGHSIRPFANRQMARVLAACDGIEDRVLVLIQLKGGNDGVNTLIPIEQYDDYANLRPGIRLDETTLIALDNTLPAADQIGLHPSLAALKSLYDDGRATVIQGVGYEAMNQSHFKGTDIWLTGGDTTPEGYSIPSGWMGRSLQALYPDVQGAPTPEMPDPLGIQLGDPNPSLGFHTETEHQNSINLSGQDAAGFYSLIQTIGGLPVPNVPDSDHGDELSFIMNVEQSVNLYAQRITDTFNNGSNANSNYPTTALADQLKTIAKLMSGGCKTKIYLCTLGGFDTHAGQAADNDTTNGAHADLLFTLAEAAKAFLDDLEGLGLAEQVLACTFSEFGRTAAENGSNGTDHGTLAPIFIFGKNAAAGVQGTNVNLKNLTPDKQLQGLQFDYRQVFTTLLQDWLGADNYVLEQTMFEGYAKLPVVDTAAVVRPECYFGTTSVWDVAPGVRAMSLYPNPASINAEVTFVSERAFEGILSLHSLGGRLLSNTRVWVQPDINLFYLDVSQIPAGTYFVRLENSGTGRAEVCKLVVAR
ncbi:MAG: DUF1501 domain-containing protein [Saprospiraceae bacterium]|nr:DUF1501 domain-containing protein [Saprospiraceae bacterium]